LLLLSLLFFLLFFLLFLLLLRVVFLLLVISSSCTSRSSCTSPSSCSRSSCYCCSFSSALRMLFERDFVTACLGGTFTVTASVWLSSQNKGTEIKTIFANKVER
jgi:hypothetical protein